MTLDATEVGLQAARVMEDLENAAAAGNLGEAPQVVAALVIYEVRSEDGDSTVGARVTDDRNVVGLGLAVRAHEAMLRPDGDLSEEG